MTLNAGNRDYEFSPKGDRRTLLQSQNAMIGDAERIILLAVGKESECEIPITKAAAKMLAKSGDFHMNYSFVQDGPGGEKVFVLKIERDNPIVLAS